MSGFNDNYNLHMIYIIIIWFILLLLHYKLMISFIVPTKPDWSGLVLSTQNLSYNSEFVHLPSWYRPLLSNWWRCFLDLLVLFLFACVFWSCSALSFLGHRIFQSWHKIFLQDWTSVLNLSRCSVDLCYPVRFSYLPLKQVVQFDNEKCYLLNYDLLMSTPTTTLNLPLK